MARLERRNSLVKAAEADVLDAARVEVTVVEVEGGLRGEVSIEWRGITTHRSVTSDTCDEAVTALALIAALDLEPVEEPRTPPTRPDSERSAIVSLRATQPAATAAVRPAPVPPVAPAPVRPPRRRLQLGGGLAIRTAAARDALVGYQTQVRLVDREPFVHSASLGLSRGWGDSTPTPAGTGRFDLIAAELRICPWMWSRGPVQAGPCASLEAGRLRGKGDLDGKAPDEAGEPFAETGGWIEPALLVDWRVSTGPVLFSVASGPGFPLVRDRFFFELTTDEGTRRFIAHQAPPLDWRAEVSMGVSFPQ
jgi:hypothetical protein